MNSSRPLIATDSYKRYSINDNSCTEHETPLSSDSEMSLASSRKRRRSCGESVNNQYQSLHPSRPHHIRLTRSSRDSPTRLGSESPRPSSKNSQIPSHSTTPATSRSETQSSSSPDVSDTEDEGFSSLLGKRLDSSDDQSDDSAMYTPTCPICLQPYTRRAYVQPCFHSFCFMCILQWMELSGGLCPMCKRESDFLAYDADLDSGTFKRWYLQKNASGDRRGVSLNGPRSSRSLEFVGNSNENAAGDGASSRDLAVFARRRAIYIQSLQPTTAYPISPFLAYTTHLTPAQLVRTIPFIRRDLQAILGAGYEKMIEEHVVSILMQEHETKGKKTREQVVEMLRPWLDEENDGEDGKRVADRFVDEVMAFVRSGMDLGKWDRVVKYAPICRDVSC
ncbi:hypothetical protein BC938DRAFT_483132 [Jimgerdemannia flammicorona]|uniref:RING-type E3 ubiquitin transferase n=1 Tax=Jimgerdemannia flammicorona TaxID=994334 RepID=A0A433QVW8_9FUNG|nr:hypothetical protein BC938DRAFT_483132 [Jimgerdemannia flammicorona]